MSGWPVISVVLLGIACVYVVVACYTWRRRSVPGLAAYTGIIAAGSLYLGGYACELAPACAAYVAWCENVTFLGALLFPPLIMCVFADFTGHERWLPRWLRFALFGFAALDIMSKLTDHWHGLTHRTITLEPRGSWNSFSITPGPLYWVTNGYVLTAMVFALFAVAHTWPHANRIFRRQLAAVTVSIMIPASAHLWRLSGYSPWGSLDLVPFAIPPGMLILAWTVWHDRFAGHTPIARNRVLAMMRDAIVVADPAHRVADLNPAAAQLLRVYELDAVGQPLAQVLARWPDLLELTRLDENRRLEIAAPPPAETVWDADWRRLTEDGRHRGFLLNLRDVTERRRAEQQLHQLLTSRTRELREATARALSAGAEEQDRIGQELHDTVCPELIGIVRQAELLALQGTTDEAVNQRLRDLAALAGNASRRVRDLSHLLARPDVAHTQFEDLLYAQLHQLEQTLGLTCELAIDHEFPAPTPEASGHLLRIIREAVVNAARHAGARRVWVDCVQQGGCVTISVSNDGRPLSDGVVSSDGLGFRQMRMRAELLDATLVLRATATGAVMELSFAAVPAASSTATPVAT
ncbi:histidine kinase N-terminal 7TM domain-containing protein [Opitutus terrae]|uniref:Putative PAS/PAC sensor protein n=1 Tax=Opitutus terrae (strain DSM 11246 / JCM 15787 / PB90-1) TaxID=452637 RepID=B1ZP36_OPITP|nr:histidine kinase N-terminal 7TM domain-containing protein [Opitutus terrae]ACB77522.1 putative PAS/PAC sensor protein [Opitutus terrae PB90-1]